jgi:D-apiose dehydrogenase
MSLAVAIVGLGYFSQFHQEAWSRCPEARVIGIADNDPARVAEAAKRFPQARTFHNLEAMLDAEKPDCLDIVTPQNTHLELVRSAAEREISAVICQKPLAPGWNEAVAVVESAERPGIELIVHENFRFMPWFRETKQLVDNGKVGTPLHIAFVLRPGDGQGPNAYLDRQPYFRSMPRFLIHETGIHLIDVFRYLLGEITGVFARLKRFNPAISGEDAGIVIFDFECGATGIFDGNRLTDHPAVDTRMTNGMMLLEGTGGTIRLDGFGRLFLKPHGSRETEHPYIWQNRGFGGDCVYLQTRHIVEHLVKASPLVNEGRAYLRNCAIEEAIYRSANENRFLAVL